MNKQLLEDRLRTVAELLSSAAGEINAHHSARVVAEESHAGQMRNTLAFMKERDEALARISTLTTAIDALLDAYQVYTDGHCRSPGAPFREEIAALILAKRGT